MSHELTEDLEDLRRTVEAFAHDVVAPVIGGHYERHEFPYELVREMGRMGLFGLPFGEDHGGMGGDSRRCAWPSRSWPGSTQSSR